MLALSLDYWFYQHEFKKDPNDMKPNIDLFK